MDLKQALKKEIKSLVNTILPVHSVFVEASEMKLRLKKHELFIQKCSNLLYKALIRSGSIPFVPKDLPLMEIPTMIIGLR